MENIVRLSAPEDIRLKGNAPETNYSPLLGTGYSVVRGLASVQIRSLIHEEISLLSVLEFPFRVLNPQCTVVFSEPVSGRSGAYLVVFPSAGGVASPRRLPLGDGKVQSMPFSLS
jgi:hypothetical protein